MVFAFSFVLAHLQLCFIVVVFDFMNAKFCVKRKALFIEIFCWEFFVHEIFSFFSDA